MTVRTRIAPSPTGEDLHIGNLYTAFINWAFAKKNNGQFIVRIEDTDRARLVEGAEEKILTTLDAFGLSPDEKPVRQSERLSTYKEYAEKLVESGHAYYCYCTKERLEALRDSQQKESKPTRYDKHCLNSEKVKNENEKRSYVIRLNVPENKSVSFNDLIRGKITISTSEIDDQVILKSDGYPTYHLAVVVDDYLMKITHVIRAEEWISSTPKHVLLYEALGWELPIFAHVPILRNPDRSKLSKRKNPVWASWYLEEGYLPEAILNYLALMGWSHPEEKEIFSIDEFVSVLDLKDIAANGPVFDLTKLTWMNGEYLRAMSAENLQSAIFNFHKGKYSQELIQKTIPLIHERIKTLKEYDDYCQFFIESPKKYEIELNKYDELLKSNSESLSLLEDWQADKIGEVMQQVADQSGLKNSEFFMALRVAITGRKISPPLNESMEILGKEEVMARLKTIA